jgi:hypothetical protein
MAGMFYRIAWGSSKGFAKQRESKVTVFDPSPASMRQRAAEPWRREETA